MPRDYYEVLGVARGADDDAIRRAYRGLARQYHPDVNQSPEAEERFQEISAAYEVLSDAEKRRAYDRFGHAGVAAGAGGGGAGGPYQWTGGGPGGPGGPGPDIGDLFEQMFGGRGAPFGGGARTATGRSRRGGDVRHALTVTFMTAALGGQEEIRLTSSDGGSERITVRVPAGIEAGARLRVKGKGHPSAAGERGDLIVTVDVGGHPYFRREGLDIVMDVPVTITEACLGVTVTVPLLKGSADLRVPPGTSSGQRLRVREQGITGPGDRQGDFLAVIQIVAPTALSDRGQGLLRDLASELKNPRETGPWADRG